MKFADFTFKDFVLIFELIDAKTENKLVIFQNADAKISTTKRNVIDMNKLNGTTKFHSSLNKQIFGYGVKYNKI